MRIRRRTVKHAFENVLDEAGGEHPLAQFSGPLAGGSALLGALVGLAEADERPEQAKPTSLSAAYEAGAAEGRSSEPPRSESGGEPATLAVRPGLAAGELRRMRRRFALANHPDRVPPERREAAARAMAEANAEIDRALKSARKA